MLTCLLSWLPSRRVAKGAVYLDVEALWGSRVPKDWHWRVDLERLDVESPVHCPLGQIFGDYMDGLDALGIYESRKQYGFVCMLPTSVGVRIWLIEAALLTRAWRREILRRRKTTPAPCRCLLCRPTPAEVAELRELAPVS